MKIICSELYEKQLKEILSEIASHDFKTAKDFKTYLDTIIINAPTKSRKYKQSVFFDDENIKDIEYDKYTIPLLIDDENDSYIVLGIVKK